MMKKIITLMLCLTLFGCASSITKEQQALLDQYKRSHNYPALINYYKGQLALDPENSGLQLTIAELYLNNKDLESANFYLHRALEQNKENGHLYRLLGDVYNKQQKYSDALDSYYLAKQYGDDSKELYMGMGIANAQLGLYQYAINNLNEARLRGGNELDIKNNLGLVYVYQGEYQKAVDILFPLYQTQPDNSKVGANLAVALLKMGRTNDLNRVLLQLGYENSQQVSQFSTVVEKRGFFVDKRDVLDIPESKQAKSIDVALHNVVKTKKAEVLNNTSAKKVKMNNDEESKTIVTKQYQRIYYLQLGSFRYQKEAEQQKKLFAKKGLKVAIRPAMVNGKKWYRLALGQEATLHGVKVFAKQQAKQLKNHQYVIQLEKTVIQPKQQEAVANDRALKDVMSGEAV
ncbi:SPOR domain-containing protein [Vibrio sp. SS-MA-C1-2]|uniref:SPOR domain-containing protein n=1 Tax=Vibrio sp. SS-MA-C1-2 TaxID=2908646 RepID=UPI001F3A3784|nr:SPOR domain-containing protein [Vibrio sp. SS-MA-C1-2]UJF17513.1 SPOR domain-containing protein [Vibrio sp. SS-MA-C1-2]